MSVVITGAGGLIGRHLVPAMRDRGEIFAVTRSAQPVAGATTIAADLSGDFVAALPARADTVVHLAQSSRYRDFPDGAADVFNVNVASTAKLLDWARTAGVSRFILASAGGARANSTAPIANYLASKLAAEALAESFGAQFAVIVLRFHFVYGRGQRSSMLIPRLIDNVRNGRPITLQGVNGIEITPTHVSDAVAAVVRSIDVAGNHRIDIGGPEVLSMRAIGECIGGKLGREPQFAVEDREGESVVADRSAMRALLGAPRVTLDAGLDDVLA